MKDLSTKTAMLSLIPETYGTKLGAFKFLTSPKREKFPPAKKESKVEVWPANNPL
jgi:hypothetical protein